jgi:hypothetical protein
MKTIGSTLRISAERSVQQRDDTANPETNRPSEDGPRSDFAAYSLDRERDPQHNCECHEAGQGCDHRI